jgi:hypothetical protein
MITFATKKNILYNSMSLIDKIRQPISAEMRIFKSIFAEALKTDNPLLSTYTRRPANKEDAEKKEKSEKK